MALTSSLYAGLRPVEKPRYVVVGAEAASGQSELIVVLLSRLMLR